MNFAWQKPVEDLFKKVMEDLKLEGWVLEWQNESYCWRHSKKIHLSMLENENSCKQMLLHEIAHAMIVEDGNQHSERYFDFLNYLIKRYLNQKFDEHQTKLAKIYVSEWSKKNL
jgi:hypothetical protein